MKKPSILIGGVVGLCALGAPVSAFAVEDFYSGRTITLTIGFGEGGGYDIYARVIAQHLGKYIPGNPDIIPVNLPGASSVVAAQYLYNVAPRDGTQLGFFLSGIPLAKVTDSSLQFEPENFSWIGRADSAATIGIARENAPALTVEDVIGTELVVGALGATGTAATVPWAFNEILGTQFNVITGYTSSAEAALAFERGEVDGIGSLSLEYLLTSQPDWLDSGYAVPMYTVSMERHPDLPDVPAIVEFTDDPEDRQLLALLGSTATIGRALVGTPEIPADRLEALRDAFEQMLEDPDFRADLELRSMGFDPLSGERLEEIVRDLANTPPALIDRLNSLGQ